MAKQAEPELGPTPDSVARYARTFTNAMLDRLVQVALDEDQPGATTVRAVKEILDRGWGTPSSQADILRALQEGHGQLESGAIKFIMPMNVEGTTPELTTGQDDLQDADTAA